MPDGGSYIIEAGPSQSSQISADDLIPIETVLAKTGLSISTVYLWMSQGRFPLGVRLSGRCVRWVRGEVDAWNRGRTAARIDLRAPPASPPPAAAATRRGRGRPRKA